MLSSFHQPHTLWRRIGSYQIVTRHLHSIGRLSTAGCSASFPSTFSSATAASFSSKTHTQACCCQRHFSTNASPETPSPTQTTSNTATANSPSDSTAPATNAGQKPLAYTWQKVPRDKFAHARVPSETNLSNEAKEIQKEFSIGEYAYPRGPKSSKTKPLQKSPAASASNEPLSEIVTSTTLVRHFLIRKPCHPTSILSLPILNQLRSELHSHAFAKMVIRASVNPTGWKIAPDWDFDDRLAIPNKRNHSNWGKQAALMNLCEPTPAITPQSTNSDSTVTAVQAEPFTRELIEANLHDFISSPQLHQCPELVKAVFEHQKEYVTCADQLAKEFQNTSIGRYISQEKSIKKALLAKWTPHVPAIYRILVNQFIKFMEEPIGETPTAAQQEDVASLNAAIGSTRSLSSMQSELLKSRSGRLRFDPTLIPLSNLSAPHQWYELARSIPRKIIIHVGPTNSGKTYHAMQRLMSAKSGVYCGPLRLLAWEVYDKITKAGVPCNLLTGQEVEETAGAAHTSSTVEMVSTSTIMDVAVIDECQMLGSNDRGWAWTRAILGVPAYEIHVCGDPSMVGLVEELASITGEEVEVREYERLTPLLIAPPLENGIRGIQKGDCVVGFSAKMLYELKQQIEEQLGLKCCIIYGSLPPETRRFQAEKFNTPDSGYDVLVATDAIGMGLNLNIRRVVFARMDKYDGYTTRALTVSETLQIAGRAGRYSTGSQSTAGITTLEEAKESNMGYVTTLHPEDHTYLQWAMKQTLLPIERAGLAPTQEQLETLHSLRPKEKLSNLITYFGQYAQVDQTYFSVDMDNFKTIADLTEHITFPSMAARYEFCRAPCRIVGGGAMAAAVVCFAELFAAGELVYLRSFKIPALKLPTNRFGFVAMEELYAITELYIWLGFRCGEKIFVDLWKAIEIRQKTAAIIQTGLERLSPSDSILAKRRRLVETRQSQAQLTAAKESALVQSELDAAEAELESFVGKRKDKPIMRKTFARRTDLKL